MTRLISFTELTGPPSDSNRTSNHVFFSRPCQQPMGKILFSEDRYGNPVRTSALALEVLICQTINTIPATPYSATGSHASSTG